MSPTNAIALLMLLAGAAVHGEVVRLEVKQVTPAFGGRSFADVGSYERIDAIAHFRVDPDQVATAGILHLRDAPRDSDRRVAFDADVVILRPATRAKASGVLVYEPVNRGQSLLLGMFNGASGRDFASAEGAGDGWLMAHGHALVISGWQVDYPAAA